MSHVEVVELGNSIFSNELGDGRISLREPSEELRNTKEPEPVSKPVSQ